ncbi:hypothetical protein [Pseudomonas nicosulfuronedens]
MNGEISISITVDQQQAQSYLTWLVQQYELAMTEFWFDDRYRRVSGPSASSKTTHTCSAWCAPFVSSAANFGGCRHEGHG